MKRKTRTVELQRERGAILFFCILLVVFVGGLTTAFTVVAQKNTVQGRYFNSLGALRRYAENGVQLAIHELSYGVNGGDGSIGTELWTTAGDVGRDGRPGTSDEGEANGIPTPGEPNLAPVPIGPSVLGMGLFVQTTDTAWPNVKRIVATAFNDEAIANIEVFARRTPRTPPPLGAAYVDAGTQVKFGGNLLIDGNDHNPDGTPGPAPPVYGISTSIGDPAGSSALDLALQVPSKYNDQILGLGGQPSIGEVPPVEMGPIFDEFKGKKTKTVPPGTHTDVVWGDWASKDLEVIHATGDISLGGNAKGAEVLVVDGSLTLTGKTQFVGVILVRGDVKLSGGGNEVQIYGSLIVSEPTELNFRATGSPEVKYSSWAISQAFALLGKDYEVVSWNYR
jgi:hypothetical protein